MTMKASRLPSMVIMNQQPSVEEIGGDILTLGKDWTLYLSGMLLGMGYLRRGIEMLPSNSIPRLASR